MTEYAAAIDIGTSGIRAVFLNCDEKSAISKIQTAYHPIPGRNILDQLLFQNHSGLRNTQKLLVNTINNLIDGFDPSKEIIKIAVCANPGQISLLKGTESRDLFLNPEVLKRKGIKAPIRTSEVIDSADLGFDISCDLLIPPSISAMVGADAVALIYNSIIPENKPTLSIDLGTNAEMALKAGDKIYVGSAAAGPAIEGQQIRHGMLASTGAIAGLEYDWGWKIKILDEKMNLSNGDTVNLHKAAPIKKGLVNAKGITGTGVIAIVAAGLSSGIIQPPNIYTPSKKIFLQDQIDFSETDLIEAGKAFGAIRSGYHSLAEHAGISVDDIATCNISGTAGCFADPLNARDVGIIPQSAGTIFNHGNTSLQLACSLACGDTNISELQNIADSAEYVSFSTSKVFQQYFLEELSYWCEGRYKNSQKNIQIPKIVLLPDKWATDNIKTVNPAFRVKASNNDTDISKFKGLCPNNAITKEDTWFEINTGKCAGTACLRCVDEGLDLIHPQI